VAALSFSLSVTLTLDFDLELLVAVGIATARPAGITREARLLAAVLWTVAKETFGIVTV